MVSRHPSPQALTAFRFTGLGVAIFQQTELVDVVVDDLEHAVKHRPP
jgi:hypothetical protein